VSKSFPRVIRSNDGRRPCTMRCGNLCRGPICDLCRDALRAEAIGAASPRDIALSQMQQTKAYVEIAMGQAGDTITRKILARGLESLLIAKTALEQGHRRVD
jgi:hypothetical protein